MPKLPSFRIWQIFLTMYLSTLVRTLGQEHTNTLRHSAKLFYIFGTLMVLSSENHKPINPHPHPHTVHSNSPGSECTDKVYSPAAPSTSDMQEIVMPDLFDMKRWEGNITAGNVWERWTSSVKKTWKGTTERGCLVCSTTTSDCILMCWNIHTHYNNNQRNAYARKLRLLSWVFLSAEVLLGHK